MRLSRKEPPPTDTAHWQSVVNRQMARIMSGPPKPKPLPNRLMDAEEVMRVLRLPRSTLGHHLRVGLVPPPTKGLAPGAGEERESWRRISRRWPAVLINAIASGALPRVVRSPEDWQHIQELLTA